jgi:hypothetical protein
LGDALVRAPESEKAARFASAETIRSLEWGTRSYQSFVFGLSLDPPTNVGVDRVVTGQMPSELG